MIPSRLVAVIALFVGAAASAQENTSPQKFLHGHSGAVTCLAISPDGTLASGSADKTIRLWDGVSGKSLATLQGHDGAVRALQFAPNGQLVSGSEDGTVRFWDLKTRRAVTKLPHPLPVYALALSADGRLLATGTGESKRGLRTRIHFWDVEKVKEVGDLDSPRSVSALDFSTKDSTLISTNDWGMAILWNGAKRYPVKVLPRLWDNPRAAKFSADGRFVTTGYENGVVVLWDVKAGEEQAIRRCHSLAVSAAAFTPDSAWLATAGKDGAVKIFLVSRFEEAAPLTLRAHVGTVTSVVFSPNGKTLYSAGEDKSIALWDVAAALKTLPPVQSVPALKTLPGAKTPARVALVSAVDSEPVRNLLDLAQVELSQQKDLVLLEREKMRALLQEQKLSLTGLVDAGTAVAAGKILGVDLFAVVEVSPGGKEILGTVIYDATTGVKWQDRAVPSAGLDVQKSALVTAVREAASKRSRGVKGVRTLCFVSTRNADLPRSKDALCQSVGVLLERHLLGSPQVALLERKRLDWVNKEKALPTDADGRDLLSSLLLVDLEISRGKQGKGLYAVAIISDNLGKLLHKVEAATPGLEAAALAELLQAEMQKVLHIAAPPRTPNLFRESRRFAKEAADRVTYKDFLPAIQAIETAHALDPTNPMIRGDLVNHVSAYARELLCPGTYRTGVGYTLEVSNESLKKSLRYILRALEVRHAALDHLPQFNPGGLTEAFWSIRFPPQYYYNNLAHAGYKTKGASPWDDEADQMRAQVVAAEQEFLRRRWQLYRAFLKNDAAVFSEYTAATFAYLDALNGINASSMTRLGVKPNPEKDDPLRLTILRRWLEAAQLLDLRCDGKILDDLIHAVPPRPVFTPFFEELSRHPQPLLSLEGRFRLLTKDATAKTIPGPEAQQKFQDLKKDVLQTIRNYQIEPGIPEKEDLRFGCYWFYFHALKQWQFPTREQGLEERFALCDFMLERQELMIEPIKETAWSSIFGKDPYAERRWSLLKRALTLANSPQRQLASFVGQFRIDAKQIQATLIKQQPHLAKELPAPPSPVLAPPFWDKKHQLLAWSDLTWVLQVSDPLVIGPDAYIAVCGIKEDKFWLETLKISLEAKTVAKVGSVLVKNYPYKDHWLLKCITGLCVADKRLFVGTDKNGIYAFSLATGKAANLDEEFELPAQEVDGLVSADGKLLVALRGYLVQLDLQTKTVTTLASSRRRQRLSPFDDSEIFNIQSMVADPPRQRVLFLLYQRPHFIYYPPSAVASKDATNGLWEYNWQTKIFERHIEMFWSSLTHISPVQNGHVTISGTGIFDLDLTTDHLQFLSCSYPVGPRYPKDKALSQEPWENIGTARWFHDGWLYTVDPLSRIDLAQKKRTYFPRLGDAKEGTYWRFNTPLSLVPVERGQLLCVDRAGVWLLELKK